MPNSLPRHQANSASATGLAPVLDSARMNRSFNRASEPTRAHQSGQTPARDRGQRSKTFLVLLVVAMLLGGALRVWAIIAIPTVPVSDFWSYLQRGISLHERDRYEDTPGIPNASFPPGYPLLLAASFSVTDKYLLAAKVVNCMLGAASIVLVGLLGRRLGGEQAGALAAFILALYPRSILVCCLIASENLFTPLLLVFVPLVASGLAKPRAFAIATDAGVILGMLTGTRIVARYLGLLWPISALALRRRPLRTVALETILIVAMQHIVLLPWAFWNLRTLGKFTFSTSNSAAALFEANSDAATGEWFDWGEAIEAQVPGATQLGPHELNSLLFRESVRWIRAHPGEALAGYVSRFGDLFAHDSHAASWAIFAVDSPPFPESEVLPGEHLLKRHEEAVTWALELPSWALLLAAGGGLIWLLPKALAGRQPGLGGATLVAVFGAAAYQVLLIPVFITVARYRWPLEDLLVPFAAAAFAGLAASVCTAVRDRRARGGARGPHL